MSDFDWGDTPKGQTKSSTSYVDKNDLLREVYKKTANDRTIRIDCMASFVNLVNAQPTTDMVKVVRCEKCTYGYIDPNNFSGYCRKHRDMIYANDFCSKGERIDE